MSFIDTYFIEPIYTNSGYNLVNTIVYALIAIAALFGIYKILQKLNFKVDNRFFYAILPFIVFGSSVRALVDHQIFNYGFWLVSPGIYILTAAIFLGIFFPSYLAGKNKNAWKLTLISGILLDAALWIYAATKSIKFTNLTYGAGILCLALLASIILHFIFRKTKFIGGKYFLPFSAHMLDASATFIAVDFLGAIEEHPLPNMLSHLVGTAAIMYALKLIVLIPLVYLLNKEFKDKNFVAYLAIAIAVLGLAEGLRDLLTIIIV
jgi:uncharacterized membrane protein